MSKRKWTKEQLEKASQLAQEMFLEWDEGKSRQQNMKDALMRRVEDCDADQVTADLQEGIDAFHSTFRKAQEEGMSSLVDSKLDEMLSGYDEREQELLLAEILAGCAKASGQAVPEEITESGSLEALKEAVKEYITEYSVLDMDCEVTARMLQEIGADSIRELQEAEEFSRKESYTALAVYILMVTGELTDIPAGMSAKEIGVCTAASCCEQQTIFDAIRGKIDWDEVKSILKLIAGCAVLTILAIIVIKVGYVAALVTAMLVQSIVGLGIIGTVAAFIFAFIAVKGIAGTVYPITAKVGEVSGVSEKADALSARIGEWFNKTVRPALVSFWEKIQNNLRAFAGSVGNDVEAAEQTAPVVNRQPEEAAVNA